MKSLLNNAVVEEIKSDPRYQSATKVNQNWSSDPLFFNYHKIGNKQKGVAGELVVEKIMSSRGSTVEPTDNTDYDRIIDGYNTEIKFGLATSKKGDIIEDKFIINHVALTKKWERLIFCGINPLSSEARERIYFMEKTDFEKFMATDQDIFKHQQSGKKGGNDDYICTKVSEFLELDFVKPISEWSR